MSTFLCMVLFVAFALAQLLCTKHATHKVIRYIPMLISAVGCVVAIGLHIYARITYSLGVVSESVLAENQYFASFILIPAGICLIGAVVGFLIGKKLSMNKKALFVFAIILVALLCVPAWFYGYYNRKSNDNIPSKELMVSYCQNQGVDYATERLQGYKYTQLIEVWGEPDSSLSGMWGDIWETNNTYCLIVYYDSNGVVEHVTVRND